MEYIGMHTGLGGLLQGVVRFWQVLAFSRFFFSIWVLASWLARRTGVMAGG